MNTHSGFISILGPTNSGKSTLLNALLGEKISIVSPKQQTTYRPVRGIRTHEGLQAVYIDTPGFQGHRASIARLLNEVALRQGQDADLALWVFDASEERVLNQFEKLKEKISTLKPADKTWLVLNKVDKIAKPNLLPLLEAFHKSGLFCEMFCISARKNDGVEALAKSLEARLPEGPQFYPAEQKTDRDFNFQVSEIIRENIYACTRQEIPYSVYVEMENWEKEAEELAPAPSKIPTYHATIHVDSPSKKGILVGKRGQMIQNIGSRARKALEEKLGKQICLKLFIDVKPRWTENATLIKSYLELES